MTFQIGQCWTSEGEPELGIGFVKALDATSLAMEYPSASQGRLYRKKAPPLRRLEFRVSERIQSKAGVSITIERIDTRNDLFWYVAADGTEICESELSPKLTLQRPMERFLAGHWDKLRSFALRKRTLEFAHRNRRSPVRGMMGPRVQLLPHQVYVTDQICKRGLPRALLADEVGLGKTIEAAWVMHRLLGTGRIRRILILVPESLVNQWFVELFRRFNLSFWVPASQSEEELELADIADQERVILSLEAFADLAENGKLKTSDWDLVIVDEAHRIQWSETNPSPEYQVLTELAQKAPGLLLLTATPEQLGLAGHFSRLRLIDPQRFASFEAFEKEHDAYRKVVRIADRIISGEKLTATDLKSLDAMLGSIVAPEILESLKNASETKVLSHDRRLAALSLIDHYGTGRVYFRNSRSVVELEHCAFPKRTLVKHALEGAKAAESDAAFLLWLADFAKAHVTEKTLLICSSAKKVVEWEKRLRDDHAIKVVAFHEDLSLLARDRNAAYFEDPKGATLLLCSEIGGEGRNFQQASHLILADLPEDPDVVEQRIGRLDRIGQLSDISIHVPYFAKTATERLIRWHDEVFHGFSSPPKGAREIYDLYREPLHTLLEKTFTKASETEFMALVATAAKAYETQLAKIEAGRDRLIEINSFDPVSAPLLVKEIETAELPTELNTYFEDLLDAMGLHSDDLDEDSLFVDPGHSEYVSYFPGLPPEGMSFTFSRAKALRRPDLTLMTWDHPMVTDTLAQLVTQEFGNVSVAAWSKSALVIECSFVFESAATDAKWYADEFFPVSPIRVVLEASGRDLTPELAWEPLRKSLSALTPTAQAFVKKLPSERIRGLLKKAQGQAQATAKPIMTEALAKMHATVDAEIARLKKLQTKNKLVSELEIQWWNDRKANLLNAFSGAQVRLDSFLLVVPAQWGTQ